MASVESRTNADGSVSHRVKYREDGVQLTETFYTAKAAEEFKGLVERIGPAAARQVRDARTEAARQAGAPTVAEIVRTHIDGLSGLEAGTLDDYRSYLRLNVEQSKLGFLPVTVVTKADFAAWVNALSDKGLSGKTIKNRHALLSASMNTAVDLGWRPDNPCKGVRLPRTTRRAETYLTHDEFAVFLTAFDPFWHPLVMTLFGTGVRWGEATALWRRYCNLDDDRPSIRVEQAWKHTDGKPPKLGPPKSRKGRRTVLISPQVVDAIRPLLAGKRPGDIVFRNRRDRPVRHNTFSEGPWATAVQRVNDPEWCEARGFAPMGKHPTIHDARHTHAAWLISASVSLAVVQRRLGHESIQTTVDVYGHLTNDALEGAVDAVTVALAPAAPELLELEA